MHICIRVWEVCGWGFRVEIFRRQERESEFLFQQVHLLLSVSFLPSREALICETKIIWHLITASLVRTKPKGLGNHLLILFSLILLWSYWLFCYFWKIPINHSQNYVVDISSAFSYAKYLMADLSPLSRIWSNIIYSINLYELYSNYNFPPICICITFSVVHIIYYYLLCLLVIFWFSFFSSTIIRR